MQTSQPFYFVPAMLMGIISLELQFIPLLVTLTVAGQLVF